MNRIFDDKLNKIHIIFLSYCPFPKFWTLTFCNYDFPECDIVLKLHVWIPHGKIVDDFFLIISPEVVGSNPGSVNSFVDFFFFIFLIQ